MYINILKFKNIRDPCQFSGWVGDDEKFFPQGYDILRLFYDEFKGLSNQSNSCGQGS